MSKLNDKCLRLIGVPLVAVMSNFIFFKRQTIHPSFSLQDHRMRGRFITLGISYGFGMGEAMEFSGKKNDQ